MFCAPLLKMSKGWKCWSLLLMGATSCANYYINYCKCNINLYTFTVGKNALFIYCRLWQSVVLHQPFASTWKLPCFQLSAKCTVTDHPPPVFAVCFFVFLNFFLHDLLVYFCSLSTTELCLEHACTSMRRTLQVYTLQSSSTSCVLCMGQIWLYIILVLIKYNNEMWGVPLWLCRGVRLHTNMKKKKRKQRQSLTHWPRKIHMCDLT